MKTDIFINIQKNFKPVCLFLALICFISIPRVVAQDDSESESEPVKKVRPILKLLSNKYDDNSRTLTGIFSYKDTETREFFKVKGIALNFYAGVDSIVELGSFTTNEDGMAVCKINPEIKLPKDEEGYIHFSVEFEGNDFFRASDNELDLIDLELQLSLEILDSVKTVIVKAEKILANDERVPLTEVDLPIYVQRMFSQLKVGEITLDEGEGSFEFPANVPGDTLGMVTIIAKFDDHEDYAYLRKSQSIDWGVVTSHHTIYHPRSLWTQVAPIWMIVTLSVMLLGVWGHYIFVMIEMVRLKRGPKEIIE